MNDDRLLENYLAELERHLAALSPSRRSEIIVETRNRANAGRETSPRKPLREILEEMGDPRVVASRHTGRPVPQPRKSGAGRKLLKFIAFSFLFVMIAGIGAAIWFGSRYWPVYEVDEDAGRIMMFGGKIDVNTNEGSVRLGSTFLRADREKGISEGSHPLDAGSNVTVEFNEGRFQVHTAQGAELEWKCQAGGDVRMPSFRVVNQAYTVDLKSMDDPDCKLRIPAQTYFQIRGESGAIAFIGPRFEVDAELGRGDVVLSPAEGANYLYKLSVRDGKIDRFEAPPADIADSELYRVEIGVDQGAIRRSEDR